MSNSLVLDNQALYTNANLEIYRPDDHVDWTVSAVRRKEISSINTMSALQESAFSPSKTKQFERTWRIGQAANLVGRSAQTIRQYERDELLPPPSTESGIRHYTLPEINYMRHVFGTLPWRAPEDEPCVLSFSSFKGGCGKSCLSVHFAQYMALRGYRVLFVDSDPQGSATTLFGINPDLPGANGSEDTRTFEGFYGGLCTFKETIRPSYFPGIDIVPADMGLNNSEYLLSAEGNVDLNLVRLRDAIRGVWQDYDVIVIDPPPALGLLALSVLTAANSLAIPLRPTVVDFASTSKFLSMLRNVLQNLSQSGVDFFYHFQSLVVNGMDDSKSAHVDIVDGMRKVFSEVDFIDATMKDSAEIDNAGKEMNTVYDLLEPTTSHQTYKRAITYLDRLNHELELRVRKTWQSHRSSLRAEAQI